MNYNDFLTRQQQIKKLSIAEQKNFYEQLLKKKYDKTEVRILIRIPLSYCPVLT